MFSTISPARIGNFNVFKYMWRYFLKTLQLVLCDSCYNLKCLIYSCFVIGYYIFFSTISPVGIGNFGYFNNNRYFFQDPSTVTITFILWFKMASIWIDVYVNYFLSSGRYYCIKWYTCLFCLLVRKKTWFCLCL